VLVFIQQATRRVYLAGITVHPTGRWVTHRARELPERLSGHRFLIRDRDTTFTNRFDAVLAAAGVWVIKASPQAPRANAICERVVGTLRRECLDRLLIFGPVNSKACSTNTWRTTTGIVLTDTEPTTVGGKPAPAWAPSRWHRRASRRPGRADTSIPTGGMTTMTFSARTG
jgi:hypothetical protein